MKENLRSITGNTVSVKVVLRHKEIVAVKVVLHDRKKSNR